MLNNNLPLVSICCATYNHEKFIKEALDGFLMQKVNFSVEIIVHDDASTDKTSNIIREYSNQNSQIIAVIQRKNLMSTGQNPTIDHALLRARGKYIALCDGDDYWTDPYKLQKQVDFLENNPEFSLCFHNVMVSYPNSGKLIEFADLETREYSGIECIETWKTATCSYLFRNQITFPPYFSIFGDIVILLQLAETGKIYCINDTMGVYRKHNNGISYTYTIHTHINLVRQYSEMNKYYNYKYNSVLKKRIIDHCLNITYSEDVDYSRQLKYSWIIFITSPSYIFKRGFFINLINSSIKSVLKFSHGK